jgi:hypothetical protein
MSVLSNWTSIAQSYADIADQFIETINPAVLTLEYKTFTNGSSSLLGQGLSQDNIGNPDYIENMFNRQDQHGSLVEGSASETIKCRAYWNSAEFKFPIEFKNNLDVGKVIIYTTDVAKVLNASFIYVDGVRAKSVTEPVSYGFLNRYSEFYVEKVKENGR